MCVKTRNIVCFCDQISTFETRKMSHTVRWHTFDGTAMSLKLKSFEFGEKSGSDHSGLLHEVEEMKSQRDNALAIAKEMAMELETSRHALLVLSVDNQTLRAELVSREAGILESIKQKAWDMNEDSTRVRT